MKKQLLLVAMAIMAMTAGAQVVETGKVVCMGSPLPRLFTNVDQLFFENIEDENEYYTHPTYSIYDGEFNLVRSFSYDFSKYGGLGAAVIVFNDFDDYSNYYIGESYLTQTVFNDDDKFEFIRFNFEDGEIENGTNYQGKHCSGFSIVQEDGTVLQSIRNERIFFYFLPYSLTEGDIAVVKLNGKFYLMIEEYIKNSKEETQKVLYLIEKGANSVKRVAAIPDINVRPRVAERNETITVELGEGSNAREIQVVNAAGQMVKNIPVTKGQRQVTFSTEGMGRGMNVVRGGKNSCKIIVK